MGRHGHLWRPVTTCLNRVTYGNGYFYAVGDGGAILSSTNGTDWTAETSGTIEGLYGVAFGNGNFVITGTNGVILLRDHPVPNISAVTPSVGTLASGTSVTITGTGFTGATAVKFGNQDATSFSVTSDTQITATAPSGTDGTVDITVTAPGGTSATSTADKFTYVGTAPTVILSTTTIGKTNLSTIPVTITFSKDVTGFVIGDISVTNGTASGFVQVTAQKYTVDITPTANGTVNVDLAAGVARDIADQGNTAATTLSLIYDNIAPTVTISTAYSSSTNNSPIALAILFSEAVTGFDVGDITVSAGTKGTLNGSGASYSINITPTGQGTITVDIAADIAQDGAGNNNNAATQYGIGYDTVAPTVVISSTTAATTSTSPIPITITFSEDVTGFTSDDISVSNGTLGTLSGSGTVYSINVVPSGSGTVTVDIASDAAKDAAGNNSSAATPLSRSFVSAAPSITTLSVSTYTATTADMGGNVTADNGIAVTERGVVYSSTDNTPSIGEAVTQVANGSGTGSFSETVFGLVASTTYYVRAYAINSGGTSYGALVSFTTRAAAPTATTLAASSISSTTATLNGSVNANNASSTVTFEYGTTTFYGTSVTATPNTVTGTSSTSVSAGITGLTPNTTYHYRVRGW